MLFLFRAQGGVLTAKSGFANAQQAAIARGFAQQVREMAIFF